MVCLKKILFYVQSISIYIIDTADCKDNQLPLDATDYKVRIIHSNEFWRKNSKTETCCDSIDLEILIRSDFI